MTAPLQQVQQLVDRHGRDRLRITRRLVEFLTRLFARLDPYSGRSVAEFASQAAQASRAAQGLAARSAEAHQRAQLRLLDAPPPPRPARLPAELRGIPLERVYERPAEEIRYLESVQVPRDEARNRGRARLVVIADDDLNLAAREAVRQTLTPVEKVIGYRRVLRPELSETGPCGLCIAASDRVYAKGELLPLHERCKCIVLPMTQTNDPGQALNKADLARVYAAAGGTDAAKLKRVRVEVHDHGELGAVLRAAGHEFRGPRKAARAAAPRDLVAEARAEIATLERSYASLLARQQAGEDVSGPLAWQQARLELLRSRQSA